MPRVPSVALQRQPRRNRPCRIADQSLESRSDLRYSYRILFIPGTIGSITWLARNQDRLHRIRHGLVISCVGHGKKFTYKRSRRGDADIDKIVEHALRGSTTPFEIQPFFPWGYDERQYCSPGFNLPVGSLMRSPHGTFPEYHTSADDLEFVDGGALSESLAMYQDVVAMLGRKPQLCEPATLWGAATGKTRLVFGHRRRQQICRTATHDAMGAKPVGRQALGAGYR